MPALRELQQRVGRGEKDRVDLIIAQVQGRATGGTGALSIPTQEGGGVAVVPED